MEGSSEEMEGSSNVGSGGGRFQTIPVTREHTCFHRKR